MARATTGPRGEQAAVEWLQRQGFSVLARNARVGRLELDIVARRGDLVVFCEVKTARAGAHVAPHERLRPEQQARLRRAAAGWLRAHPQAGIQEIRLDAAFVRLSEQGAVVDYFEAAF